MWTDRRLNEKNKYVLYYLLNSKDMQELMVQLSSNVPCLHSFPGTTGITKSLKILLILAQRETFLIDIPKFTTPASFLSIECITFLLVCNFVFICVTIWFLCLLLSCP